MPLVLCTIIILALRKTHTFTIPWNNYIQRFFWFVKFGKIGSNIPSLGTDSFFILAICAALDSVQLT